MPSSVEQIERNAFYFCKGLQSVVLPEGLTTINNETFYNCESLKNITLPSSLQTIGNYAFRNCDIHEIVLGPVTWVGSSVMYANKNLILVDWRGSAPVGSSAFYNCYKLTTVVLRHETLCALNNTNAFYNCYHFYGTVNTTYNPDGLKDGYIYVPSALVEEYKAATNWSTFADQFRALEDYTVDGTITGELDESKI